MSLLLESGYPNSVSISSKRWEVFFPNNSASLTSKSSWVNRESEGNMTLMVCMTSPDSLVFFFFLFFWFFVATSPDCWGSTPDGLLAISVEEDDVGSGELAKQGELHAVEGCNSEKTSKLSLSMLLRLSCWRRTRSKENRHRVHDLAERWPDLLRQFDRVRHRIIRDFRHEDNIIGMDVL